MDPLTIGLIMGGSALMNALNNRNQNLKDATMMKAQATKEQWSPWTGVNPAQYEPKGTDTMSATLQGGLAGLKTAGSLGAFGDPKVSDTDVSASTVADNQGQGPVALKAAPAYDSEYSFLGEPANKPEDPWSWIGKKYGTKK